MHDDGPGVLGLALPARGSRAARTRRTRDAADKETSATHQRADEMRCSPLHVNVADYEGMRLRVIRDGKPCAQAFLDSPAPPEAAAPPAAQAVDTLRTKLLTPSRSESFSSFHHTTPGVWFHVSVVKRKLMMNDDGPGVFGLARPA